MAHDVSTGAGSCLLLNQTEKPVLQLRPFFLGRPAIKQLNRADQQSAYTFKCVVRTCADVVGLLPDRENWYTGMPVIIETLVY